MSISVRSRADDTEDVHIPLADLAGIRVGVVLWGGLALVDVRSATHAPPYAALVAIAVLVTVAAVGMSIATALVEAGVGWLVVDGFVLHSLGVLGLDGMPGLALLGLLVALATTASRARR
jgi:hypothetical protein